MRATYNYPVDPNSIAKDYKFKGEPLEMYQNFIGQMNDIYKKEYAYLDNAILPIGDKKFLLSLFKYHINNVGNPDGHCQYGLATRGIEFKLLQTIFTYLNMKPYGEPYNAEIDPTSSFGYYTLGHKEAMVWAIKAAKTRLNNKPKLAAFCAKKSASIFIYDAAVLLNLDELIVIENDTQLQEFYDQGTQNNSDTSLIFVLTVTPDATDRQMTLWREAISGVRAKYKDCFIHLIASSVLDLAKFANGFNIFLQNSPKFYAYPPQEGTTSQLSGDFYVDTISISSTRSGDTSFSSGVLLTTTGIKHSFNDKIVSYIGSQDSTVVGSSNGDFCLIDYYFYSRFPFALLALCRKGNKEELRENMGRFSLSDQQREMYSHLEDHLEKGKNNSLGYPANHLWNDEDLNDLFTLLIKEKIIRNTEHKIFEKGMSLSLSKNSGSTPMPYVKIFITEILDFFKEALFSSDLKNEFDGYVTTGGTEGNYVGLFIAKRHLEKKVEDYAVLFLTKETHYSVGKGASIFDLPTQNVNIISAESGNMDWDDLKYKIEKHKKEKSERKKRLKVIINVNLASTQKGSIDDLTEINRVLKECNFNEGDYWIHCDAALQGCLLPFIDYDDAKKVIPFILPKNDKRHVPIHSIAISGHKFMGAPFPCGVSLFQRESATQVIEHLFEKIPEAVRYCIKDDYYEKFGTITSGSQNNYMAVVLWKRIKQLGREGLERFAKNCIAVAEYAETELSKAVVETGVRPFRNKYSNIITLSPSPTKVVRDKYSLPNIEGGDNMGHIVIMPHVSTDKIDELIDYMKQNPIPIADGDIE
jgi:histidine decarboxylase